MWLIIYRAIASAFQERDNVETMNSKTEVKVRMN